MKGYEKERRKSKRLVIGRKPKNWKTFVGKERIRQRLKKRMRLYLSQRRKDQLLRPQTKIP